MYDDDNGMVYDKQVQIALLSTSCVIITIVNTLCICVIIRAPKLRRKPPTILITNLIGTHMIQGVCVLPLYIIRTSGIITTNRAKRMICDGFYFTYMLTFYGATISVFLLLIDRLLAVRLLTKYEIHVNRKTVCVATLIAWTYVLGLCLLPFLDFGRTKALKFSECSYLQPQGWTIFMLVVNALIPYILVIVGYAYIQKKLNELSSYFTDLEKQQEKHENKKEQKKLEKRKKKFQFNKKVTKLTFIVIATYGLTWSPTIFYYLLQHICTQCFAEKYYNSDIKRFLSFLMKYLNFFDAIFAPIIYCYFHDDFRKEFQRVFCKKNNAVVQTSESNGISINNGNLTETTFSG